jgi:flavin reductase (DIM6/NTAB) family NADH-FMN oxidoreductase RutF
MSEVYRRACRRFATGIAVLTTVDASGAPCGMTVNTFTGLSLDPPLIGVAVDRTSIQLAAFEASGVFAINVLKEEQQETSNLFASAVEVEDRFAAIPWSAGSTGAPVLGGALAVLECRTEKVVDAGDHRLFIGQLVRASCPEEHERPLVYFNRGYVRLA